MTRPIALLSGFLLACAFSFLLNASDIQSFTRGDLTLAHLGAQFGSADETYYFALLHEVKDGFWKMGNSSFFEHRSAPSLTGYALLPQGLLARAGLELTTVVLIGDILFPLFIAFAIFLIAFRLFHRLPEALLFTAAFLLHWNVGLLRTMSPQVTMSVFFTALFFFLTDRQCRLPWIRGLLLTLTILVQPICAVLLIVLEGLDFLVVAFQQRRLFPLFLQRYPIIVLPFLVVCFQSLSIALSADPDILADLSARRGLIMSRLPSDPKTSLLLLSFGILWFLRLRQKQYRDTTATLMIMLSCAGLIVLNQQIFHGREAIFGLYYNVPLTFFLVLTAFLLLRELIPRWLFLSALSLTLGFAAIDVVPAIQSTFAARITFTEVLKNSGVPEVLEVLSKLPGQRIVFAPIEVSNFVPVFTDDYTFFTQYAHYEYASDRELAERYLVMRQIFPLPEEQTVVGDPLVFGLAAGNLYARTKTMCRLTNTVGLSARDCDSFALPDFIRHQDLRQLVDAGNVNAEEILAKYNVDTVITLDPIPEILASHCRPSGAGGPYTIYDCRFDS